MRSICFRTYLRDPNARAKVIEQSEAVTAQYKAATEAADAVKAIDPGRERRRRPM